jgi:hypothetical protein
MIVWEWGQPRTYQGYLWMGPIQIPPLPELIVLTDRGYADLGLPPKLWLLMFDPIKNPLGPIPDRFEHIKISDVIPQRLLDRTGKLGPASDVQVYDDPYNGPVVGVDTVNRIQDFLFVRSATMIAGEQTVIDPTAAHLGVDRRSIAKQSGLVSTAHRGDQGTGQSLFLRVPGNTRQYANLYTSASSPGRTAYTDAQVLP